MNTHLKNGKLSAYGFSCGYVEKEEKGIYKKELLKEDNVYKVFCNKNTDQEWNTYYTLGEARKKYNIIKL